ncbi:MAG: metallophosphoesterase [Phycisphaerales bacterium]
MNPTAANESSGLSRRNVLALLAGTAGAAALSAVPGCQTVPQGSSARDPRSRRLIRVAHMTDFHIQPERKADEGVRMALDSIHAMSDKPDVIVTGGDLVMDSFDQQRPRTDQLWKLYTDAIREHCKIPVVHCLGNHDIWGWNKAKSKTTGTEMGWGKKNAIDLLGLPNSYYSTMLPSRSGASVKLIVLDSVQSDGGDGYVGGLDDAQFEWLKGELAATPSTTTILAVTHVPVLHAATLLRDSEVPTKEIGWHIAAGETYLDSRRVVNLFQRYPNAKLVMSGHIHMHERLEYAGMTYINGGAVCGSWWRAETKLMQQREGDTPEALGAPSPRSLPGYSIIDVNADGPIVWEYRTYGWVNEPQT